jgi:hypothetical protein
MPAARSAIKSDSEVRRSNGARGVEDRFGAATWLMNRPIEGQGTRGVGREPEPCRDDGPLVRDRRRRWDRQQGNRMTLGAFGTRARLGRRHGRGDSRVGRGCGGRDQERFRGGEAEWVIRTVGPSLRRRGTEGEDEGHHPSPRNPQPRQRRRTAHTGLASQTLIGEQYAVPTVSGCNADGQEKTGEVRTKAATGGPPGLPRRALDGARGELYHDTCSQLPKWRNWQTR